MHKGGIKKSNYMFADFHFKIIHMCHISSNNRLSHLFNVESLRSGGC